MRVPLQVCEQRDAKGLYKKARAGQCTGFTGEASHPYTATTWSSCVAAYWPKDIKHARDVWPADCFLQGLTTHTRSQRRQSSPWMPGMPVASCRA